MLVRHSNPKAGGGARTARWAAALCAAALPALSGCVLEDITSFTQSLTPPSPGEAARMMFDPHNPDNRREGTVLISNSPFGGVEDYVRAYRTMVEIEEDPIVLATAIRALARHGQPSDAVIIAVHLFDESDQVRWEAAKGLQRLHNPEVVDDLLRVVRNEYEMADVREAVAVALGQYPQDRSFQGLVEALQARELAVNLAAEESLKLLTGQSFNMDPVAWLDWYRVAQAKGDPFAGAQEYLYPVFARDESWFEKINIFKQNVYEQSAPPAGLAPESTRRTYEDQDEQPEQGGGD